MKIIGIILLLSSYVAFTLCCAGGFWDMNEVQGCGLAFYAFATACLGLIAVNEK